MNSGLKVVKLFLMIFPVNKLRPVIEGVVMPSTSTSCSPSFVIRECFRLNPVFKEGKVKVLHIWKTHEKV